MSKSYSFFKAVLASVLVLFFSNGAGAVSTNVGASLISKQAIVISNVQDANFGSIEFASNHSGGIYLGTNGHITLDSAIGLALSGSTSAGSFDISSDGSAMEISCERTGARLTSGANFLPISAVDFTTGAGGPFASGSGCQGIGENPLVVSGATTVKIGVGIIIGIGFFLQNGSYSTANAGGKPITFNIVYQ